MNKDEFKKRLDELSQEIINNIYALMKTEEVPFAMLDLTIIAAKDSDPECLYGVRVAPKESLGVIVSPSGSMFAIMPGEQKLDIGNTEEARKKAVGDMLDEVLKNRKEDKPNGTD